MKILRLIFLFLFVFTSVGFAETSENLKMGQFFIGISGGQAKYEENNFPDIEIPVAVARTGFFIMDCIALEARYGMGVADDSLEGSDYNADFEIDNFYGAYLSGYLPVQDIASIYVLTGYSKGKASADLTSDYYDGVIEASETESSFSYGGGVEIYMGRFGINFEYMNYLDKDDYEIKILSSGIKYNF